MSAMNPDYIAPGCCVNCARRTMQFAAAALNPSGEQKGICATCYKVTFANVFDAGRRKNSCHGIILKIEAGDFD